MNADLLSPEEAALQVKDKAEKPLRQICIAVLDGVLNRQELAALVAEKLADLPRWRSVPTRLPVPVWNVDAGFNLSGHVREFTLEQNEPLEPWLLERLATPNDADHPAWELWLGKLPHERSSLLVLLSHPSLGLRRHLMSALLTNHPGKSSGAELPPNQVPENPFEPLAGLGRGLHAAFDSARSTVLKPKPAKLYIAGVETDWTQLRSFAQTFNCTVHDIIMTLVAGGLQQTPAMPKNDAIALVPLAINAEGGIAPLGRKIYLPLTDADLLQTLQNVASLTQSHVATGISVAANVLRDIPTPDQHGQAATTLATGGGHSVYVMNAPGSATDLYCGENRVSKLSAVTTPTQSLVSVGITRYKQQVSFAASAKIELTGFGRGIMATLASLREVAGS